MYESYLVVPPGTCIIFEKNADASTQFYTVHCTKTTDDCYYNHYNRI